MGPPVAHDALITTIAVALAAAWLLGILTHRLGLSPIVGYLLAGMLIGPHTPGFVGDVALAAQLAEMGVVLLMFGVGLHFHLDDLLAVRRIAVSGALLQSAAATALGVAAALWFGWSLPAGLVLGLALSVASTVVLMRALEDRELLDTSHGHVAVGWLIVEDILTVAVLVTIPALGGIGAAGAAPRPLLATLAIALLKLAALVGILLTAGSRLVPRLLEYAARLRSRELFTLTVLALALAIAASSAHFFGASMALGAFLAGMVVGQSKVSQQAAAEALPLRDAFAVLFFVSVGMLFDPRFVVREPALVGAALAIVLVGKPLVAMAVVVVLGYSVRTGLTVALGLAQIGEFSFILGELGRHHGLLPDAGLSLIVACAIVSITLNPVLFRSLDRIEARLKRMPRVWRLLNRRADRRRDGINEAAAEALEGVRGSVLVVGYGPVGRSVDRLLRQVGLPTVVIDTNLDTIGELEREGRPALFGDASRGEVLKQAGAARATHLVITLPHGVNRAPMITAARSLNPSLRILVRARYLREARELEQAGASAACYEELEAAVALGRAVLAEVGADPAETEREIGQIRRQLSSEPPGV